MNSEITKFPELIHADKLTIRDDFHTGLNSFSFHLMPGEILGLVGFSNSGQQTLVDFLTGKNVLNSGRFIYDGAVIHSGFIKQSWRLGIHCIGNVPQIFPSLSIAENLCVIRAGSPLYEYINSNQINALVQNILDDYDLPYSPLMSANLLTRSQQHVLELIKAQMINSKIVIFSNSLSEYTESEFYHLGTIIKSMQKSGTAFIMTESRLDRVLELVDRIMLIRNGRSCGAFNKGQINKQQIQQILTGKNFQLNVNKNYITEEFPSLIVTKLYSRQKLANISFNVKKGEIVGFFTLDESDSSVIADILLGFSEYESGEIMISGEVCTSKRLQKTRLNEIGYFGKPGPSRLLFSTLSIKDNLVLGTTDKFTTHMGYIKNKVVSYAFNQVSDLIGLKNSDLRKTISEISHDAQISLIFHKAYIKGVSIMIIENPFSGSDMITQQLILSQIVEAQQRNLAVLFFSNNYSEIQTICNRVYLLRDQTIVGEFTGADIANIGIDKIFGSYDL